MPHSGLATDPLLVRFSGADVSTWRRAVAGSSGTAAAVGLVTGVGVLIVAAALSGTTRMAFLALGLTLPGLLLQDSWRFAFFALGKGSRAFLNDTVWALAMVPALLVVKLTGHASVFWFVFAWGASACIAAAIGPLQAGVRPSLSGARRWVSDNRDLGPRYLLEGTTNSAAIQLRTYGVGIVLGLAVIGYVQAGYTLMGPFYVVLFGAALVITPEAVRVSRRSRRRLSLFCIAVSTVLALLALAWGLILLVALPRGLGELLIPNLWRQTYPLILPLTISIMGQCVSGGASVGLHALGAAKRSLRAMVLSSIAYVVFCVAGAVTGGAVGTVRGAAIATWIGALLFWGEFRQALREAPDPSGVPSWQEAPPNASAEASGPLPGSTGF